MTLMIDIPPVNVIHNASSIHSRVGVEYIFLNPRDKVVFEGSLDNLMKQIWRKELTNICSGKVRREWLEIMKSMSTETTMSSRYTPLYPHQSQTRSTGSHLPPSITDAR